MRTAPLRLTRFLAPALLALTAACSGGGDEGAHTSAARDSAGVAIVEHARVPEPLAALATLDSGALVIGALDGQPAYTFGRIADVASLPGGGVAVADSRAAEVRVFDSDGTHVVTLGGTGEGPGEFTTLSGLAGTAGDTVWAWDGRAQRLTTFLTDGTVVAEATREGPFTERITGFLDRLPDGTFLAESAWRRAGPPATGSVDWHLTRDTVVFRRLNPRLELLDTVAVLPAREYMLAQNIAAGAGTFSTSTAQRARPFTRSLYFDSHDGQLVSGLSDSYAWERRSADGTLLQAVRAPALDRAITPADVTALKARYLAGSPGATADAIDALFGDFPLPDTLPAFEAIHVDSGGRVWLSRFRLHDDGPTVWVVFGREGALLGEVSTPDGFTVHEIGEDYVLGVRWDEFDVSYAARYPLRWKE